MIYSVDDGRVPSFHEIPCAIDGVKPGIALTLASGTAALATATANNGFNYNFGRWNVIIWGYLNQFITSGTKPWVLADTRYNKEYQGAVWLDRTSLEVTSKIADNDANVWKGYARFIGGFNDWRFAAVGGVTDGTTLISA